MSPTRSHRMLAIAVLAATWMIYFAYPKIKHDMPHVSPVPEYSSPSASLGSQGISLLPEKSTPLPKAAERLLILFTYAESETARQNLAFFVKHGLHGAADFIFIFNGETNATAFVPSRENIKVVQRNNTCFDLGACGEVLRKNELWRGYDKFILMNASLRGPFLPYWSDSCWSDLFLSKVTDTVKLVGMTVNCLPRFHLQSMIFATDKVGLELLLDPEAALTASIPDIYGGYEDPVGLSGCYENWWKAVHAEIGTTSIIMNAGYGVDVMMSGFHRGVDHKGYCETTRGMEDVLNPDRYFGFNIHPYETVFIKSNRGITPGLVQHLSAWMEADGYSSYDKCRPKESWY